MIAGMGRGLAGIRGLGYRQQAWMVAYAAVAAWLVHKIFRATLSLSMLAFASLPGDDGPLPEAYWQAQAHARARIVALTGLADEPGGWSLHSDGITVEVLSKGTASRSIPRPLVLDPRTSSDVPRSAFSIKDGVAMVRVETNMDLCREILGQSTASHFATRPLEYSLDRKKWSEAATGSPCERPNGKEPLFVRAAQSQR